jgi:soluble lytic murein transglycosylase
MQCEGYAQLGAGRRRLIVGMDLASRSGFWDRPEQHEDWLWRCLYPEPFAGWVGEAAERWQVPPALVYAVMRQESGFRPHVESPAKAKGLMQIIAPTAERIAEELGEPLQTARLTSPRDNIRFGVFYLHKLLELFQSHPAPAAAAYNAGPKAALRWQHATAELPVEVFVARIPYDETRAYVQRVLGNLRVYQTLYPELGGLEIPLTLGTSVNAPLASRELQLDPDLY